MNNYYRPSQLSIDTHAQKYFDDEDGSILDENILDGSALDSGLEMSPAMDGSRRESYAISSTLFSPKSEEWQHVEMQPSSSNNPFVEHNNNPFMNMAHTSTFGQQPHNGWPLGNASGSCTPMQSFDGLPAEFQGNGYRSGQVQTLFSNGNQQSLFSPASTVIESMPTSPQKDWTLADNMESRGMPKRMRPSSPGLRSHSPLMRRDGIRKKNARFDIPAERNLLNIDHLIQQSTDEVEIKELKQQKRLLRNRQAAYVPHYLVFSPRWFPFTNIHVGSIRGNARSSTRSGSRTRRSTTLLFSPTWKRSWPMLRLHWTAAHAKSSSTSSTSRTCKWRRRR